MNRIVGKLGHCPTCAGKVSTTAHRCPHCGECSFQAHRFTLRTRPCEFCKGTGKQAEADYCSSCHGHGYQCEHYTIDRRTGDLIQTWFSAPQKPPRIHRGNERGIISMMLVFAVLVGLALFIVSTVK
jgi:hypothetical protein